MDSRLLRRSTKLAQLVAVRQHCRYGRPYAADNRRNCDFQLALSFVPKVGIYEVLFTGSDCTTAPCTALSSTTAFNFSVSPGTAVGLLVRPGGSSGQYVTGPDFPEDTIDVSAAESLIWATC